MIDEKQMTLAVDFRGQADLDGWFVSQKHRDCRVYWDGGEFWTRAGNLVKAPKWFKRGLPKFAVDGGIIAGLHGFNAASNAVRFGGRWFEDAFLQFIPFDLPGMVATWDKRITEANRALRGVSHAAALKFSRIGPENHWVDVMLGLRRRRAEGGMFRHPEVTTYETGRSANLLRVKFEGER